MSSKYIPSSEVETKPIPFKNIWAKYALTIVFVNAAIWIAALFYVVKAKTVYVSEWSLNIANSGVSSNINLPNIGQAVSQESSAYSATTYDPRENYKTIAISEEVLKAAARASNMSVVEFGKPKIKIIDNTTMMQFTLQGSSPQEAHKKSVALFHALEIKLNKLRRDEIGQQNTRLQKGIDDLRRKLKISQDRLSNYRSQSGVSSDEQIKNLAVNIETLRKQRAETIAKAQEEKARLLQLSGNLGLSSQDASDAFSLQADTLFQKYLLAYNDAKSKLISLNAKFLPNHPVSLTQKAEVATSEEALLNRARIVLKRPLTLADVDRLTFGNADTSGSKRTTFSEQLVSAAVETQGLEAQVRTLDREILELERRLKVLSAKQATIEDLNREVQVAEAVFSSTIARLDLAKSSISNSYPPVQIMGDPSIPDKPAGPTKEIVLLGTLVSSIFLTSGIITMGQRSQRSFSYYSLKER
ncbi:MULTISPECIES: GumC family protein [Nostocales]|uniref:Polysaccharide chain length determinant N-terminal domain-containing protein n=3 Tax=Nostocales TaxID=1161 RepID=A0A0C1R688_9CYAN|nr:hypothetical protein [Tolypothrix bouteillei]